MLLAVGSAGTIVVSSNLKVASGSPINSEPGKFILQTVSKSLTFVAPIAPKNVQYKANGVQWSQTARPNLSPITTSNGVALKVITMTLNMWLKDYEQSIDDQLQILESLSNTPENIHIEYEKRTAGEWNITALDYSSIERQSGTHEITRADVNIEFTEAVTFTTKSTPTPTTNLTKIPTVHIVVAGETWQSIANDFNTTWQKIADYNKVNGKPMGVNMLQPKLKLKIP